MNASQSAPYIPNSSSLVIKYQDADLAVVVKPPNLLTVPGRGPEKADCAENRLRAQGHRFVRAAHRLDQDTSGLLIFGLSAAGHRAANMMFEARKVEKVYEALVWETRPEPRINWLINLPLGLDWPNRPKHMVDNVRGKPSQTQVKRVDRLPNGQLRLHLTPITGRSHQLRVHLAHTDLPICGDPLYGRPGDGFSRLCLHASYLRFDHPLRGTPLVFESLAEF